MHEEKISDVEKKCKVMYNSNILRTYIICDKPLKHGQVTWYLKLNQNQKKNKVTIQKCLYGGRIFMMASKCAFLKVKYSHTILGSNKNYTGNYNGMQ